MQLSAVDLMAFMLFSQIAIAAYLLYSFHDQEREARKRNATLLTQIERLFAELEKRAATGAYRTTEELERLIGRDAEPRPLVAKAPAAASAKPGFS